MTKNDRYLIIFDLDDTIYPEKAYVISGFKAISKIIERRGFSDYPTTLSHLISLFDDGVRGNTFNILLDKLKITSSMLTVEELVSIYRTHVPSISPWPDALNLLTYLSKSSDKYIICLISDGLPHQQNNKINALNIRHFFQHVTITDELGGIDYRKPNPKSFEILLEKFNITPTRSLYLADNPLKDFIGPNKLGMLTIRVRKPEGIYSSAEAINKEASADHTIKSLDEMNRILKTMFIA
ncbi:MAG: HAD family hydrolase [Candidatus Hodarchaeales archaeon]|jgi:putative hydrolase of the HAD superfamily